MTVALNGDGGDEAFAGYQRYYADRIGDAYGLVPGFVRHKVSDRALQALPVQADRPMERSNVMALRQLAHAADMSHAASILRWGGYFSESEKRALYTPDVSQAIDGTATAALLESSFRRAPAGNRLDRTLYTDIHNYLPGALLPKVDRTTMAHSLEARSPFLDQEVLALTARLPSGWKVRGRHTKWIMGETFADLLPPEVQKRGKVGFSVPLALWFRGKLYDPARSLLLGADSQLRDYVRTDAVQGLLEANKNGLADNGKRIWALLNLEIWLRYMKEPYAVAGI